jgi:hypothetical protein
MIKKTLSINTLGRRTKQTILKDFVRPPASSTVSSSIVTSPGGYGGNIPGCAGGIVPETRISCGDQSDDFDRTVAIGWGGSGSGLEWTYILRPDSPFADAGATLAGGDTASVGGGGGSLISEPVGDGRAFGAAVASRVPYTDVNEDYEILMRISWDLLGSNADNGTQHALDIAHRGPDEPSGTLGSGREDLLVDGRTYIYSSGVRIVWKEYPARGLGDSYLNISGGTQVEMDPIQSGRQYYLRINSSALAVAAAFWPSDQDESTATRILGSRAPGSIVYPPGLVIMNAGNFQGHATVTNAMESVVRVHSVIVNPAAGVLLCSDPTSDLGIYRETLYRKQYYWRPQVTNVSYYKDVWFDGISVQEGVHYSIEDGYKIVPTDYELPTDTVVEAEIVVT